MAFSVDLPKGQHGKGQRKTKDLGSLMHQAPITDKKIKRGLAVNMNQGAMGAKTQAGYASPGQRMQQGGFGRKKSAHK